MKNVKIRDLVNYLSEKHCDIDDCYADYVDWWIDDTIENSDGELNETNILDLELDDYIGEIDDFVMSCLRNEFGNILYDVDVMVREQKLYDVFADIMDLTDYDELEQNELGGGYKHYRDVYLQALYDKHFDKYDIETAFKKWDDFMEKLEKEMEKK